MNRRGWLLSLAALGLAGSLAGVPAAQEPAAANPFEQAGWSTPANVVDAQVTATLGKHGAGLWNPCSDAVFIRRLYLDAIGTLPPAAEVEAFLADPRPEKRALLIEELFAREEFADYWSLKWSDLLRVKSEFPINLWPNAVQAYHRWIRAALRENLPYDRFARELLTSSGSNFRVPPVNFYRAVQARDPESLARAAALTFMGTRLEQWPEAQREQLAEFFSRVAYKSTGEWKEEIVHPDPAATEPLPVVFPDGSRATLASGADPRQAFADWLIAPENPWFARAAVNRIWFWTMGHGISHEPDDLRPDNPPADPELLALLERELVAANYDARHIYRLIFNSRTYQQSSIPSGGAAEPREQHARYTLRPLEAEVLIDALCWLGGDGENYSSPIPEPFTFIPREHRSIALADASISSSFLSTFGRPARDTGLLLERGSQPSEEQRLVLLNATAVQRRLDQSPQLTAAVNANRGNRPAIIRQIYLIVLSRPPTADETATGVNYFQTSGLQPRPAATDLAWALVNSKEFLYRH